jgi:vanillate O-demethylase ferredoxin subunit
VLIPLTRHAPTDPLELFIIAADAPHANARTYLDLDAYSGRILKYTPFREASIGAKMYYFGLSLHTGKIGGIVGDLCLFIGAIGALVLGVTGIQSFGGRLLRRNAKLATSGRAVPASVPAPSSTTAR